MVTGHVLFIGGPWHGTMRPMSEPLIGNPVQPTDTDDTYSAHRIHLDIDGARYVQLVYLHDGTTSRATAVSRAREALLAWYFRQGQRFELPLPPGPIS